MITVQHLQSATQIIDMAGVKILTDPWLTDGEYYGSWYHYPPFGEDNISKLEYDYIYVSHIHPDHLSESTFKKLPAKRPVLIHNYDSKFVKRKLEMLGFEVIECDNAKAFNFENGSSITIYAADNCNPELCAKFMGCGVVEKQFGSTQIDTLALFEMGNETILNTNDCPFDLAAHTIKANKLDTKSIDLLLVGYGGAGPFPQCFEFNTLDEKIAAAKAKENQFINQAVNYIELLNPTAFAPFAGTYTLGSRLVELTDFRGVPSVADAVTLLNERITVSAKGLLFENLDLYDVASKTLKKSSEKYELTLEEFKSSIAKKPLAFDNDDWDDSELENLILAAHNRFKHKAQEIGFSSKTKVVIKTDKFAFQFGTDGDVAAIAIDAPLEEPFVRLVLDHNLLHRLLRGPRFAHWNNAEIGSHLSYLRKPNQFERGLYHCLCFLHA